MEFVQIIDYRTHRGDELMALGKEWDETGSGSATAPTRTIVCRDRDDATHYVTIAFFPSYEQAMANSEAPDTDAMAKRMAELVDGAPSFANLDVVMDTP